MGTMPYSASVTRGLNVAVMSSDSDGDVRPEKSGAGTEILGAGKLTMARSGSLGKAT